MAEQLLNPSAFHLHINTYAATADRGRVFPSGARVAFIDSPLSDRYESPEICGFLGYRSPIDDIPVVTMNGPRKETAEGLPTTEFRRFVALPAQSEHPVERLTDFLNDQRQSDLYMTFWGIEKALELLKETEALADGFEDQTALLNPKQRAVFSYLPVVLREIIDLSVLHKVHYSEQTSIAA